jgi:hypothetical protein
MPSKTPQPPMTILTQSGNRSRPAAPSLTRDRGRFLPHPPATYHQQSRSSRPRASPVLYVPSPRQHGSVSSDGTASSTASSSKINHSASTSPDYVASQVEQGRRSPAKPGHMNKPIHSTTPQLMSDTARRNRDDNSAIFRYFQELEGQSQEDDRAISVLAFLATLDPLYSAFTAFYSMLIGLIFLLSSPICLCNKSFSPGNNIVRSLAPLLKQHLQFIHAESLQKLHTLDFSPTKLVLVHAISPLLSIGVAILAWVAACFWLFALVMGNPDGTERGDDGRATVLNLRNWWEKFLLSPSKRP